MKSNQDGPEKFDEEIDAALKMLSKTTPPAAMVSRVHQSLEISVATLQQAKSGRRFWMPVTCVAMAAILFLVFLQSHWTAQQNRMATVASQTIATIAAAPSSRIAAQSVRVPAENLRQRERFSQRADIQHSRRVHPHYRHAANLLSYPLTRQEKLLVRFVQTAKPEDLQALNPEYQAKVEAQQEAEFAANMKVDTN